MQNQTKQLQFELSTAFKHLQSGTDPNLVANKLRELIKKWPGQPDCLHLLAIAERKAGRFDHALSAFTQALDIQKDNPQILNNLGNLYKDLENYELALSAYDQAVNVEPKFVDALKNRGLVLYDLSRFSDAISSLDQALSLRPNDVGILVSIANCYRETKEFAKAESIYVQALELDPNHINALHNLGSALHRQQKLDAARECYEKVLQLNPAVEESRTSVALLSKEQGNIKLGLQILNQGSAINPVSTAIFELENDFYWESGDKQGFINNIIQRTEKHTSSPELVSCALGQLFNAEEFEAVAQLSKKAIDRFGLLPSISLFPGLLMIKQGQSDEAFRYFEGVLRTNPSQEALIEQIKLGIVLEKYDVSQTLLDGLLREHPNNQLFWALQSLVWQYTNQEKFEWLMRGYSDVKAFSLSVPNGYSNNVEYLKELESLLNEQHQTTTQPLAQTLRSGTQTAAKLLDKRHPLMEQFKLSLIEIVDSYIAGIEDDESHPLDRRKSKSFDFSGSWSVRLKPNGFHVNHVHPAGWISSSSYIHLPSSMTETSNTNSGAIKFGESPLKLKDRERIGKVVKPKPGMVVLFPSYCWHGTIPFDGEQGDYRMTAPFDVVPIA